MTKRDETAKEKFSDFTPEQLRALWRTFILCLLLTLAGEVFMEPHAPFALVGKPGFHALYGFLSCLAIIGFSRWIGGCLKRAENYYDQQDKGGAS